jgi:hypothetical protein
MHVVLKPYKIQHFSFFGGQFWPVCPLTQLNPIRIRITDFGSVKFEVTSVPAPGHGTLVPGFSQKEKKYLR